ncbi:hypothetical protein PsorP6_005642 [Peronosclerospora sorghi]|uniref:Uncharacterized protein n=1 Tax=Peronosclerospora sorghi TaxID=230839 RepID=A0ACC0W651_9STRA|nr:hypothetical protein PsorP6_005642 [Peronosclerospora sorghi]
MPTSLQHHRFRYLESYFTYEFPRRPNVLRQVVDALRTFYSFEHHFAVPYSFVIPSSAQWPTKLHRLPLGRKVHKLMQSLEKVTASAVKTKHEHVHEMQALETMGFPLHSWHEYQFQVVCLPALKAYAQHHGDLFVPQQFVIPSDEKDAKGTSRWPSATRGYKLGQAVAKLRKLKQESDRRARQDDTTHASALLPPHHVDALNELGFVWSVKDTKWSDFFLPGLKRYKELYGTADVPLAFTIPRHADDPRWPRRLEKYKLGRHVYMVRSGQYATHVEASKSELETLGFTFCVNDKIWLDRIYPALKTFASHYGHCDVAQDFIVPSESPWPHASWGFKLGDAVKNIRRGAYAAQVQRVRHELEAWGFIWNARHRVEKTVRTVVIPALVTHQRLYGTRTCVTTDFIVPVRDVNWPLETRGFKLGHWITRARSGKIPLSTKLRAELDKVGFVWRSNDQRWHELLLPAFRAYAALHGGSCASMSTKFTVPAQAPYPQVAWGLNLGGALWHIRNGDSYVHCHEKERELRALGIL